MTVQIKQRLVSPAKHYMKCPFAMRAEYITVHNTAMDASAANEINYMITNNNYTSYHFAVDDKEIIQGIPLTRNAYHAGDGKLGGGNRKSIGIEICYSRSGGERYRKAEALTVKLVAQLLKERGWGTDRVKSHKYWTQVGLPKGYSSYVKQCPHRILNESRWDRFLQAVRDEMNGVTVTPVSNPVVPDNTPLLRKGSKGQAVENLQALLNKKGANLFVDGIFGEGTHDAVAKFQEINKLQVDGIVGDQTWKALRSSTTVTAKVPDKVKPSAPLPTVKPKPSPRDVLLKNGSKGQAVKDAQNLLNSKGFKLKVDGIFGKDTYNAVKKFQSSRSILSDGIIGEQTWKELRKVTPKPSVSQASPAKTNSKLRLTYGSYLKYGSAGANVKSLQRALNYLGYNVGAVDGIYGNATKNAVTRFQSVYLPKEVDGIAGQNTRNKINSILK